MNPNIPTLKVSQSRQSRVYEKDRFSGMWQFLCLMGVWWAGADLCWVATISSPSFHMIFQNSDWSKGAGWCGAGPDWLPSGAWVHWLPESWAPYKPWFRWDRCMTPDFWDPGILDPLNFNAELLNFNSRIYGILSRKCFFFFQNLGFMYFDVKVLFVSDVLLLLKSIT